MLIVSFVLFISVHGYRVETKNKEMAKGGGEGGVQEKTICMLGKSVK